MMRSVHFPLLAANPALVYLDNAATMHKPACMMQALEQFYTQSYATVHRGIYAASEEATVQYAAARATIAQWLGVMPADVIITAGATASINMVASGLAGHYLQAGDEIVITALEHHANILPWQRLARQYHCVLRVVPVTASLQLDYTALHAMLSPRTKLVAVTHIANSVGTVVDIAAIAQAAHAVGALVLCDAAQSVGHLPIQFAALGVDYLVCSGHKIGGPTGIGLLVGTAESLHRLEPVFVGGGAVRTVSWEGYELAPLPVGLEPGTPPIAQAIALAATVQYWRQTIHYPDLAQHYTMLMERLVTGLAALPSITVLGDPAHLVAHSHIVSFVHASLHPHDIAAFLDRQQIAVRAGTHCAQPLFAQLALPGSVRVSLAPYTTMTQLEKLLTALAALPTV